MNTTIEEFEKLKAVYKDSKETIVRDCDNIKTREIKLIFLDNYYDYDKNELSPNYPPTLCRWDGKDTIWEWRDNLDKNTSFFICANEIRINLIYTNKPSFTVIVKDKRICFEKRPYVDYLEDDAESNINKLIKNINKMDISKTIKDIVKNIIHNSEYVYSKDYNGFRKGRFQCI